MLPKIKDPLFDVTIPSTKKPVKVRPFKVKEEKILLIARQSGEPADFFNSISQIVNNCVMDDKVNVMKLPLFDVEYLFTKIRCVSVSSKSKVSYRDVDDNKVYDFEVDLEKLEVEFPKDIVLTFKVSDTLSFTVKYPPMSLYTTKEFFNVQDDAVFDMLVKNCMDKVYDGDNVLDCSEETPESIIEFVNDLPAKMYEELRKFFANLPCMKNEIKYKNSFDKEVTISQKSIEDFFTFG